MTIFPNVGLLDQMSRHIANNSSPRILDYETSTDTGLQYRPTRPIASLPTYSSERLAQQQRFNEFTNRLLYDKAVIDNQRQQSGIIHEPFTPDPSMYTYADSTLRTPYDDNVPVHSTLPSTADLERRNAHIGYLNSTPRRDVVDVAFGSLNDTAPQRQIMYDVPPQPPIAPPLQPPPQPIINVTPPPTSSTTTSKVTIAIVVIVFAIVVFAVVRMYITQRRLEQMMMKNRYRMKYYMSNGMYGNGSEGFGRYAGGYASGYGRSSRYDFDMPLMRSSESEMLPRDGGTFF